jgi:hypothetical protein
MTRTHFALTLVLALLAAVGSRTAAASSLDANTMKLTLHTATPEEEAFIDKVLRLVDKKTLPLEMVESTYLWAKKKPRNRFQYFQRALKLRAEELGIRL